MAIFETNRHLFLEPANDKHPDISVGWLQHLQAFYTTAIMALTAVLIWAQLHPDFGSDDWYAAGRGRLMPCSIISTCISRAGGG
jgi:hypothetical protein